MWDEGGGCGGCLLEGGYDEVSLFLVLLRMGGYTYVDAGLVLCGE